MPLRLDPNQQTGSWKPATIGNALLFALPEVFFDFSTRSAFAEIGPKFVCRWLDTVTRRLPVSLLIEGVACDAVDRI